MPIFIVILLILIGTAIGGFFYVRKLLREQKNFERGLKMVPLLVHLPPLSDDIEGNNRDERDVAEENTSRAQIVYNILASTLQKGYKTKFYGQRHIAIEIVGVQGVVQFYLAVPVSMVNVIEQAVLSAYPTARLEEVAEHNIFSPVGRLSGTVGVELSLKNHFAYPIATYQDIKRDSMQSLLNALSTLDKEDGVGIQILLRPAKPAWRKKAMSFASKKRKNKDVNKNHSGGGYAFDVLKAFMKPPEDKSGSTSSKELSSTDQALLDVIDAKAQQPGFEICIRVVASSNILQRSQTLLNNIVATFSLYDLPGRNGFKFTPARDIDHFVTAFILRFFPQELSRNILNTTELATLFHFPDQENIPTSQLTRQESKQVDGPRNVPDEGLLLGYNVFRGIKKPIRLGEQDRRRHMYAVGQTGTGKSTFLENLALQDMLNGNGFAFVDPHGDTAEMLLSMVPKERTEDVIYFCPAETDYPLGLNIFEHTSEDQKDFLVQETINMLEKLYDPNNQGIVGPRYHHIFRNAALAVMADPAGGTFIDIPKLFRDPDFLNEKLKYVTDPHVLDFWRKEYPASQRSNDSGEVTAWFVSKFGAFLSNKMMCNIIGQAKSAFDLRDIMDNKKILLVNLSKGRTGDLNSKLLGMIFVMKFQAAAMSRANIPESERTDFCLYVDEFQNFSTESFATIMSEARKYRLNLIVANQFTTQLTDEIRDAVFGNMGSIVSFRVGNNDTDSLTKYFQPLFDAPDLLRVPNYNAIVRTMIGGVPTQAFSMTTLPPLGSPNKNLSSALKQLSAAKFGKPRAVVEAAISQRFMSAPAADSTSSATSFGSAPQKPGVPASSGATTKPGASFLDDWLAKRGQTPPAAPKPATISTPPAATAPSPITPPVASSSQDAPRPLEPLPTQVAEQDTQNKPVTQEQASETPNNLPELIPINPNPEPPSIPITQEQASETPDNVTDLIPINPEPAEQLAIPKDNDELQHGDTFKIER